MGHNFSTQLVLLRSLGQDIIWSYMTFTPKGLLMARLRGSHPEHHGTSGIWGTLAIHQVLQKNLRLQIRPHEDRPAVLCKDPLGHPQGASPEPLNPATPNHICRPRGRSVFYQHTPWFQTVVSDHCRGETTRTPWMSKSSPSLHNHVRQPQRSKNIIIEL